jgi:hypothetical protein
MHPAQPVDMPAAAAHQRPDVLLVSSRVELAVFAGLLTVIVIGLIVGNLIFRTIERNTVQNGAPNHE